MKRVVEDPSVCWIADIWQAVPEGPSGLAFIEVPFDYAVSHRPGARFAPAAILNALGALATTNLDRRQDVAVLPCFRLGTVAPDHDFERAYAKIEAAALEAPADWTLISIGGDHSITDPLLRATKKRFSHAEIGLVHIDAHLDCRPPRKGQEHSGHWVYTASDVISFERMAQLGVSAPVYSLEYVAELEAKGVLLRTTSEMRRDPQLVREELTHRLDGVDGLYITLDIDAIDQAFAPGTSVPCTNGLFPYEVMDLLFLLGARYRILGFDLTEVSPPLDQTGATVALAAELIHHLWAGIAAHLTAVIRGKTSPAS
ncbi:MAG: agmatinase family protein [Proteobacteria bacterium]|nr:agmatinase family protein [Pseudomonadota bacterium]